MTVKFIHTSDWQIGKVFRFVDNATMGLLQEARLRSISRLGELAGEHGAAHVVVAGDVYDMEALSPRSLNPTLGTDARFLKRPLASVAGQPRSAPPQRTLGSAPPQGFAENVIAHVVPEPAVVENEGFVLLPAPLFHRLTLDDLTAYMDDVDLPEGLVRVGLAHGTVRGFGSDDRDVANFIAPDRPRLAGLSYLALGDWHGQKQINDRCWYSGTPEIDAFDVVGGGQALLVEIEGPNAVPAVTSIPTGQYTWVRHSEQIGSHADIDHLAEKLRGTADELDRVLVHLDVEGALSLEDRQYFQEQIVDGVSAALCFMRVDDRRLFAKPTAEDLDRIDRGGFVRTAAEQLKRLADEGEGDGGIAAAALERLFVEHMKLQADER